MTGSYPHPIIAREGWPFLAVAIVVALAVTWVSGWWSIPFWLVALFVLQFFRDPSREVPGGEGTVVCPADGLVVAVEKSRDPWLERDTLKVSVFMNVFNVHSNRSPVDGEVRQVWYHAGRFLNAALDKASVENERNAVWLRTASGQDITCVQAAVAIFVAMVLDGLDGRVARLTRTQSAFGAEFDSLSDMVCFGAAPALIMYVWALQPLGRLGWIASFVYCAGAALRLARFNTNIDVVDKRFFQGLPSPAAAALCAGLIWIIDDLGVRREDTVRFLACVVTLFAGITMVSNVPFYSFKDINLRRSVPFWGILLIVLAMILISANPPVILFLMFVAYSMSGYVQWLWQWRKGRRGTASRLPPSGR